MLLSEHPKKLMTSARPTDLRVRSKLKRVRALKAVVDKQLDVYDYINPATEKGGIELDDNEDASDLRNISQVELRAEVDVGTRKKLFDFDLKGGAFTMKPTRNGRHVVLGSEGGQLSVVDRTTMSPICDVTVGQSVLDVTFLHNYTMFAAAQRKCAYIYDSISGGEVHCLKDQVSVTHLEFLQDHFLLASWAENGILRYLDTSTGKQVSRIFSKLGPCSSFRHNPETGIVHAGHGDGSVSLWTPSMQEPVLRIKSHYGPTTALACWGEMHLVTAGGDGKWKIWDLRKPDNAMAAYSYKGSPASSLDVSASGMIGMGNGVRVSVFSADAFNTTKPAKPIYLQHRVPDGINSVRFCPFEDMLLLGKNNGIGSILVPGAGTGSFDTFGANPFETRTQRREAEVKSLIEKIRPDMISLPFAVKTIGTVAAPDPEPIGPVKKVLGKKQLKRRQASSSETGASSKLENLGKPRADGSYNPLNRFK